jgi:TRAP transporter 4TM/12TM fusion protein
MAAEETTPQKGDHAVRIVITIVGVLMAIFQLVSTQHLLFDVYRFYNLHLAFSLVLVFLLLLKGKKSKGSRIYTALLLFFSLAVVVYMHLFADDIASRMGYPEGADYAFYILLLLVVLEATRRSFGYVFPILAAIFTLYAFFGYKLPSPYDAAYFPWDSMLSRLTLFSGIYGLGISVSSNYIFLFVLFGALIQITGAPRFFQEFSKLVGGRLRGGGAMSAVISSCAFGMVSGSATSNVATTGAFTIPLMKRIGYKPYQAGAIEAAASTGGSIMPPVLGSTAFLMADLTGIPYIRIAIASIIPALLYYISCGVYVQLQAMRLDIKPRQEKADIKELLLSAPSFLIPLGTLTVFLVMRFSVQFSIFWTILMVILISFSRKKDRRSLKDWLRAAAEGSVTGAKIAVTCALLGLIIGPVELTGLGIKLPVEIARIGGGNLGYVLFLTMFVALILGCGVPSQVAYMLVAMTAAPALVRIGVDLLQAHYFVFYFACLSFVTPPVAMAAFVGAGLAGANYIQTGVESTKITLGAFIVPYLAIFAPVLLFMPQNPFSAALMILSSILLVIILQLVVCGQFFTRLNLVERLVFLVPVILLVAYVVTSNLILFMAGAAFVVILTFAQIKKRNSVGMRSRLGASGGY